MKLCTASRVACHLPLHENLLLTKIKKLRWFRSEHLIQHDDDRHGETRVVVSCRVHHESEHLSAELHPAGRLLPLDIRKPQFVVDAAASPPVRPLHHVPTHAAGGCSHVGKRLGLPQVHVPLDVKQRAAGVLPVVYPPSLGEAQTQLLWVKNRVSDPNSPSSHW